MESHILAIDQSTSATKAVLFNDKARVVAKFSREHRQFYPKPGWVEHDPAEIIENTFGLIKEIVSANPDADIKALALTNQRETVVVWDAESGKPVYNAIVWQCNRGAERCKKLMDDGWERRIQEKTGLIIDPYFSATCISWILENVHEAGEKAKKGLLRFGTIDSWLIWNLTGGKVHATDYSNASRTMIYNIHELRWDKEVMDELGIPLNMAPDVKYADEVFAYTNAGMAFREPVPVTGVLGDSHAALFGQLCFSAGMGKATYGTGSSIMMNIGDKPLKSPPGLVTSIGYGINNSIKYVFEGNIHCTGATVKWLQDDLQLIDNAEETEIIAKSVESTEGVYLVPAFAGLGAPYWDNEAKAIICGMTRGTNKAHVVRAALEAIAYQVKDLVDLMTKKAGIQLKELRVDGGPVRNNFLMQFQADILSGEINRCFVEEASAMGVALAAGLSSGIWDSMEKLEKLREGETIKSKMQPELSQKLYDGWERAVRQAMFKI
jgi:glycerol kinase